MNSNTCRQHLDNLLEREITATQHLVSALESEHTAIIRHDTSALELAVKNKQQRLEDLESLSQERTSLVESHGFMPGHDSMDKCLKWCDPHGITNAMWQRLLTLACDCRDLNLLNHHLVELGIRHSHDALCVLRGEKPGNRVYDATGDTDNRHDSRILGKV